MEDLFRSLGDVPLLNYDWPVTWLFSIQCADVTTG